MAGHGFPRKPTHVRRNHHHHHHHHHHHQTRCSSAVVAAVGSIFTSLNRSIFTFHNRLLRCVSRFFRRASETPNLGATTKQGYKKLQTNEHRPDPLRKRNEKKRTIVLDLDETLVHATMEPPTRTNVDFTVRIKIEGTVIPMFIVKRPGVIEFLKRISKNYQVTVFTAGLQEYASQVLDKLDKNHVISQRLYRDSCTNINGRYAKDLSLVTKKDLGSVLIVDDNPFSYLLQPENGVHIKPFVDNMEDQELMKLADFFDRCYQYEDLRDAATELRYNKLI